MSKKTTGDDIWKNSVDKIVCIFLIFFDPNYSFLHCHSND